MKVFFLKAFALLATLLASIQLRAEPQEVEIPINIGLGPAFHQIYSPIQEKQQTIYGLQLDLAAVVTKQLIEQNKEKLPEKYRNAVLSLNEAKVGLLFIPKTIFISPLYNNTEVYGATWELLKLSTGMQFGPTTLMFGIPLQATYLYINDLYRRETTNFFRPGTGLEAEYTIKFSDSFLLAFTGGVDYYIPQTVDSGKSIYRIDSVGAILSYRWPYKARF